MLNQFTFYMNLNGANFQLMNMIYNSRSELHAPPYCLLTFNVLVLHFLDYLLLSKNVVAAILQREWRTGSGGGSSHWQSQKKNYLRRF